MTVAASGWVRRYVAASATQVLLAVLASLVPFGTPAVERRLIPAGRA